MAKRPTVADLMANRGRHQYAMLRVETLDEAAAAAAAGVELFSIPPAMIHDRRFREVAPHAFAFPGDNFYEIGGTDDFLRWALPLYKAGADGVYCSGSLKTVRELADHAIPVCGHVGLIPSKATWTGGFKAVGKTLDTAQLVWQQIKALEDAGAFAAEIEVVPHAITQAIAERTSLFLISMGAGAAGHAQYLFTDDVLGQTTGHIPRHAKVYADFASEQDRMQQMRIAAMTAAEARADGVNLNWAPMLDITHDARWGRVAEGHGELPYLCARLAEAVVRGYQGEDGDLARPGRMMATLKHFTGYGLALAGRDYAAVEASPATLMRIMEPFRAGIAAGAGAVMVAFSTLNDMPATAHRVLLHDVLRQRFGFRGMVVTDFTAIASQIVSFAAGSTTTQTVTVTVTDENLVELNETVNANIGTLSAGGRSVSIGTASDGHVHRAHVHDLTSPHTGHLEILGPGHGRRGCRVVR